MLQKELQKLTNFIAGEAAILETRPSKLEEAFTDLFEKGSVLDAEIPDPEKDDEAIEQKIQRIISELKNGSTDKESLNLALITSRPPT